VDGLPCRMRFVYNRDEGMGYMVFKRPQDKDWMLRQKYSNLTSELVDRLAIKFKESALKINGKATIRMGKTQPFNVKIA